MARVPRLSDELLHRRPAVVVQPSGVPPHPPGQRTLLLINMVFLLAISIMPFSSALVANNWDKRLAAIVYGSTMFLAAAATSASFAYATYRRRLVDDDLEAGFIRRENTIAVWLLVVLAIGAGLGFINPFFTYAMLGSLVVFCWVVIALDREGVSAGRK